MYCTYIQVALQCYLQQVNLGYGCSSVMPLYHLFMSYSTKSKLTVEQLVQWEKMCAVYSFVPRPAPFSVTQKLSQGLESKVMCTRPRVERYIVEQ